MLFFQILSALSSKKTQRANFYFTSANRLAACSVRQALPCGKHVYCVCALAVYALAVYALHIFVCFRVHQYLFVLLNEQRHADGETCFRYNRLCRP